MIDERINEEVSIQKEMDNITTQIDLCLFEIDNLKKQIEILKDKECILQDRYDLYERKLHIIQGVAA